MTNEGKTPIQLTQELLAILATRREACEQLLDSSGEQTEFQDKLRSRAEQTNRFIDELTAELSLFGDAVTSEVDRDNDYLVMWTNSKGDDDPRQMQNTFGQMESALVRIYEEADNMPIELPETLKAIIHNQALAIRSSQ